MFKYLVQMKQKGEALWTLEFHLESCANFLAHDNIYILRPFFIFIITVPKTFIL